jgi:hypothetical protein
MQNINDTLLTTLNTSMQAIIAFAPKFVLGLIFLIIGIILAAFLKQILTELFRFFKFETYLAKYGVPESKDGAQWSTIVAEIARWFVIVAFLIPTADVWGLGRFASVLDGLLSYLPNVFVAVLLLLVGFVISRLVHDLVQASVHGVSKESAKSVALIARYAVLVFVFLVVLNQLGIASDLIRILFSGIIAMLAIAGGLAFGLGGKDAAKDTIEKLRQRVK